MAYEVVARRWRPLTFDSVVGQKHVTATLAAAIQRDRVAHAFLFTGIRGVGKTTVARLLARALNCTSRDGAEPCNECSSCTQILAGCSLDVLEIDGASNRGIDDVRAIIEGSIYTPAGGGFRIYIIDEVHQLSRDAFNALLKILEEPPAHVKFVFATTEAHKLPETVLSRCQRYDFRRLTTDEIVAQLSHIAKKDKLPIEQDALALLAREADGSMRDAQSLLEQVVAATGGKVSAESVTEILGIASTDLLIGCVEAILRRDPATVVRLTTELSRTGVSPERFLHEVLEVLRHVSVARAAGLEAIGESAPEAIRTACERLKDLRDPLDLQRIFSSLLRTTDDLRRGGMPELVLEMSLLKAAMLESVNTAAEVLARLEAAGAIGGSGGPGPQRGRAGSAEVRQPSSPGSRGPQKAVGAPAGRGALGIAGPSTQPGSTHARPRAAASAASAVGGETFGEEHELSAPPSPSRASSADEQRSARTDGATQRRISAEPVAEAPQWEAFLQFVRDEAGFDLYVTLTNCEVVRLEAERIELRAMLDSFRRRLESGDTLGRLRTLATRHFEREMTVGIAGAAGVSGGLSAHSIEADRTLQLEERALADPLVRGALDVLGGKVGKISRVDE